MIAAGVVIIICAQLMPDIRSFIALLAVTAIMLIADCRYAKWAYYKTLGNREEDGQAKFRVMVVEGRSHQSLA